MWHIILVFQTLRVPLHVNIDTFLDSGCRLERLLQTLKLPSFGRCGCVNLTLIKIGFNQLCSGRRNEGGNL